MLKKIILTGLVLSGFGTAFSLTNTEKQYSQQALKALDKGDYKSYYYLKSRLKNASIYPYLQYREISKDPGMFEQSTIDRYLKQNKGKYWDTRLSEDLATYYAKNHKWKKFNEYYNNDLGVSGKCWAIQSEHELGDKNKALDDYGQLWQNRVYMSSGCTEMQKLWDKSDNKPKPYIVSKAYNLAFANKFKDSLWLLNTYVDNNKDYVDYINAWKAATKDPSKLDSFIAKYHNYRYFDKIFVDISKDLVKKDDQAYAKLWDNLKNKKYLDKKTKAECISAIAVSFARSQSPQAKQWLAKVDKRYLTAIAWEWLLRVDLYNNNFNDYIKTYYQLPKKSQQDEAWKYWLAYSYKKTNQKSKAKPIFEELTKVPLDYYSFLASDELDKPYNFGNQQADDITSSEAKDLLNQDPILEAIDLYRIGEYKESTNIWKWDIRAKLKNREITQIKELSRLAESHNMYYAAIFNMAVIGKFSNIELLFPKAFISEVNKNADKFDINKDLVLSIMRKESLFDVEAGSYAGAKGLMQVTEPTANFIAKKYKLPMVGDKSKGMSTQIYIPANNIKLGTANLYFLEKLFDKNPILGIAAYNAGPGNVNKWLGKEVTAPIWIENVPYGETRHYVRKVLVYMVVYNNFIFKDKKSKISDFLDYKISSKQKFR
ncbi:lytic transglycosylase domain-containing protein [Francisella sp. Scap27]|uniref:lytic transglycosylase domain-containing protein n=1 Tax=Francisella sp. Scap27 TaxID=2589986 RepID=UPI0015BF36B3|nr:lytic transglycosylase domain-containing protein [Francisella sp. Scap27]QLE79741.1 lytic transglycosylase domain-containing protein [Francisella sp. Scap27]